ncbi:MAG: DUF5721 family protein [Lachnospiraceae bacterium]|nr:DUF5721 family protein [Lachnospiraceae bacterium]
MLAIHIKNIKGFMNSLLLQETFDRFLVSEAAITTFTTFSISGDLRKEFFTDRSDEQAKAPERTQVLWKEIRPFCLSVIRGKRPPLSFKFVFQLSPEGVQKLLEQHDLPFQPEDVYGLFFNCQYHSELLTLTTGSSMKVFSMDHSLDQIWDTTVSRFLEKQGLLDAHDQP